MIIVGLTGSIGMGKSEAAKMLKSFGIPVFDADAAVHRLYAKGGAAVPVLEAAYSGVVKDGAVDRMALRALVLGEPQEMKRLESLVHPLVGRERIRFFAHARRRRAPIVVLDVPLLFETGGDKRVDHVCVVSAPYFVQRQRVLARPGMTAEVFEKILKQQLPDCEKRRRAGTVIPTGLGKRVTRIALARMLRKLKGRTHA